MIDLVAEIVLTILLLIAFKLMWHYYHKWQRARDYNTHLVLQISDLNQKEKALRKWIVSKKIQYDDMYEACLNDLEKWLDNWGKDEIPL